MATRAIDGSILQNPKPRDPIPSAIPATQSAVPAPPSVLPSVSYSAAVSKGLGASFVGQPVRGIFVPFRRCVWRDGRMTVSFTNEEIEKSVEPLRYALVAKFWGYRPSADDIRAMVQESWGLSEEIFVGVLNSNHLLLRFKHSGDYVKAWLRESHSFRGVTFKVFPWSPLFRPGIESSLFPVWISLPSLPCNFFGKEYLECIVSGIGRLLAIDNPTMCKTRPSVARVCVEMDFLQPIRHEVDIYLGSDKIVQKIVYDRLPSYCSYCLIRGHCLEACPRSDSRGLLKQADVDVVKGKEKMEVTAKAQHGFLNQSKQPVNAIRIDVNEQQVRVDVNKHIMNKKQAGRSIKKGQNSKNQNLNEQRTSGSEVDSVLEGRGGVKKGNSKKETTKKWVRRVFYPKASSRIVKRRLWVPKNHVTPVMSKALMGINSASNAAERTVAGEQMLQTSSKDDKKGRSGDMDLSAGESILQKDKDEEGLQQDGSQLWIKNIVTGQNVKTYHEI